MKARPRLLYLVTEDWFFHSHFLPMARAARADGFEVVVATRFSKHRAAIEREGFQTVSLPWRRSGEGPLGTARSFLAVLRLLRCQGPDILHCIALKPVIFGGLAAKLARRPATVCAITGLGRTWVSDGSRDRTLKALVGHTLRLIVCDGNARLLVENRDHERAFVRTDVAPADRVHRVPGAGVDLDRYRPADRPESSGPVVVTLVARMIPIKGVEVAVRAVRCLADHGRDIRLDLVGEPDRDHKGALSEAALARWSRHPAIRWRGWREDIPAVWREADIAILPSLGGDGLPKALLEAAACGKPIVTTDTDGCREVVRDGLNGLLVPPNDVAALAGAIDRLARDPALRRTMGQESRRLAEACFDERMVADIVAGLYRMMLHEASAGQAHGLSVIP